MNLQQSLVAKGFSTAAHTYDEAAVLQYEVATELFDTLKKIGIHPRKILDMGCGTGRMTYQLVNYWRCAGIALDCAPGMIDYANQYYGHPHIHYLCRDIENFSLPAHSYDLVWSNFALQWCADLDNLFKKINLSLTHDGLFAVALPGEQTLRELKTIWRAIDDDDHVNDFISADGLSHVLQQAGFQMIAFSQEEKIQWHGDVKSIVRSLRQVGVRNALAHRSPGLTGKKRWEKFVGAYEAYRKANKGLPVTYDIYRVIVRKP